METQTAERVAEAERTLRWYAARMLGVPTTDAELETWLLDNLGVRLPRVACCGEHTAPFDAFASAFFAREPMAVWVGSRGFAGKSYTIAALALAEAATLGAEVRILGGSADQSENVVRYTDEWTARDQVQAHLSQQATTRQAGVTRSRVRFGTGGMVDALAASTKAVRGPHPSRLRIDEADELDVRILDAALGQTMARPGVAAQTIISSTHHYADGTMTEVLRRAAERGWPVYQWCYKCTSRDNGGWLDPAEIERKRGEVPVAMWAAEYDLQEPSPESRAIMPAAVEAMFDRALGEYDGAEYIEAEEPAPDGRYVTGADWAKERDWTVIVTLRTDVEPVRVVAYERVGRVPYPIIAGRFDARLARYPGDAYHDGTGVGNAVHGFLNCDAEPVVLTGRRRTDLLSNYVAAIEGGKIVAPRIEHAYNEHKFAAVDDLYGSGHLPDSICAGALAWLGADGEPWCVYDD